MKKLKKPIKREKKKLKKLDDFKNQNLRVIFEDITSHRKEVREIEELTFKQLQNLRKRLDTAILGKKRNPTSSFSDEEDEESKEEE